MRTVKSRVIDNADRWKNTKDDRGGDRLDRPTNDPNDPRKMGRDRRKDRKNRRNDRDGKKVVDSEEFRILKPEKSESVVEPVAVVELLPPGFAKKQLDKPPKEDKVKKYSESRRERRASMRNQAAGGDNTSNDNPVVKIDDAKTVLKKDSGTPRDKKNRVSELDKQIAENAGPKEDRRSSVESNGDNKSAGSTTAKFERDVARIRKKVSFHCHWLSI